MWFEAAMKCWTSDCQLGCLSTWLARIMRYVVSTKQSRAYGMGKSVVSRGSSLRTMPIAAVVSPNQQQTGRLDG